MKIFGVDVGNSSVSLGVVEEGNCRGHLSFPRPWEAEAIAGQIGEVQEKESCVAIVVVSVAPRAGKELVGILSRVGRVPVEVYRETLPEGIAVHVAHPERVGGDRLAAALGAYARAGGAALVADVGTAITVDVVGPDGAFEGGAIAPGPALALSALGQAAELLPSLEVRAPGAALGKDTEAAMLSGCLHGAAALIEGLAKRLREAEPACRAAPLFLTGGGAELLSGLIRVPHRRIEGLVLEGLFHAYVRSGRSGRRV